MGWYSVACGLDVHRASLVACLARGEPGSPPVLDERRFDTTSQGLRGFREWLVEEGCQILGMEATGVFWRPVFRYFEGSMRVVVSNPSHVKAIRGRKTDRQDARWFAAKVREDGMPSSFIPDASVREGREWARVYGNLLRERTQVKNQTLKLLAGVGIPLSSVLSDVFGVSGLGLLTRLAEGKSAWEELADRLRGRAREKAEEVRLALEVTLRDGERDQLSFQLRRLRELESQVMEVKGRMFSWVHQFGEEQLLLTTIPGIGELAACLVLAEVGPDLKAFSSGKAFAAWAGLAPASWQTGETSRAAGTRKGNKRLQSLLVECAQAAVRTKGCHLRSKYLALKCRMAPQKAIVAIAHKLAVIIYRVLMDRVPYKEREEIEEPTETRARQLKRAIKLIQQLGGSVHLPTNSSG